MREAREAENGVVVCEHTSPQAGETEGKICVWGVRALGGCVHSSAKGKLKVLRVLKILRKNLATAHTTG